MATQYQVNTILTNGAVINSGVVTLPTANIATSTEAGLVMPVTKTAAMTQEVGVDSTGKLYTTPGGGGGITEDFVKLSGSQTFTGGTPSQISLNGAWGNWTAISLTVENYNTANIAASWGSSVILARDFRGHPTFTYKDTSGNAAECLVTIVSSSNNVVFYPTSGDMTVTGISYIGMK